MVTKAARTALKCAFSLDLSSCGEWLGLQSGEVCDPSYHTSDHCGRHMHQTYRFGIASMLFRGWART
eukprot:868486-Amphidinium_carterae.1